MIQILKFLNYAKLNNDTRVKIFIIFFTTVLFFPLFFSKLSLIDDHEIISFLNAYKTGGPKGILDQFLSLGDFNELSRFRPVYYFFRVIEIFTWTDNATLWAFFRYIIAAACSISIFKLARKNYTAFFSLSLSLLFICLPLVPDIFFRFGPSEIYAVVFFTLLLSSLTQKKDKEINLLKTSIYITLLIGIKENFLILFPLQIYGLFKTIKNKNFFHSLFLFFLSSVSFICIYIILRKLRLNAGVDVYNSIVGFDRIELILNSFLSKLGFIFLALSFSIIYYLFNYWGEKKPQAFKVENYFLIAIFSGLILFNIYFYSGIPSPNSRYSFPIWPLMVFIFAILFKEYLSRRAFKGKWVPNSSVLGWIICLILTLGFLKNLNQSFKSYKSSNQTFSSIKKAIELSKKYNIIVIHAQGANNYEQSYSLIKFLNFYAGAKMVYLILDNDNINKDISNNPLLNRMQNISFNGGWGYLGLTNSTLAHSECLNIYIELQNTPSPCHNDKKIFLK